jgi:hypothetical protein
LSVSVAGLTLLIPEKPDVERDSVGEAWRAAGGTVERLGRFWEPAPLDPAAARVYGNDTFALVLAQKLGLALVSPDDDLLVKLPSHLRKRDIALLPFSAHDGIVFPRFVKSAVPKLMRAAVYETAEDLRRECAGLEQSTLLLSSEIVRFAAELRSFVLDETVLDHAIYEGSADRSDVLPLLQDLIGTGLLPRTCVVDLGYVPGQGWMVIECNAAWGAGLNGCRADRVIGAIAAASRQNA